MSHKLEGVVDVSEVSRHRRRVRALSHCKHCLQNYGLWVGEFFNNDNFFFEDCTWGRMGVELIQTGSRGEFVKGRIRQRGM